MSRSGALWWVGVAVVLVIAGVALGRGPTSGPPLDPRSTDPQGTRALVELVEHFGADVGRGLATEDTDVVLVLEDRLAEPERNELLAWVRRGGVLVLADLSYPLVEIASEPTDGDTLPVGICDIEGLERLGSVAAEPLGVLPIEPGDRSCFGTAEEAWLVARPEGAGTVVLLGSETPLVNDNLDRADNAAVVVALLSPTPGEAVRIVYDPVGGGTGERTLAELIPDRIWWAMAQLVVAFVVLIAWRARRFGGPVAEPQSVELPGSLLVRARGDLYRRTRSHGRAAQQLQADADRRIRRVVGVPVGGPLPVAEVAARLGVPAAHVERLLLRPADPPDAHAVVALAAQLDELVRRAEPSAPTDSRDASDLRRQGVSP